ncbi:hypothetical protein J0A68_09620 [Algoriphagus sp. H41]|uniref:Thioredoxin domain-containing protein n=1 Tax=Algoriphagus oliviformis TaxID=2811231 RepID=A0ABS3C2V0_9BACT|nr:hypothetical protein [Algoriphagus oliviformis]MBN7811215.1 hypothetical protein [Algoriphagus oliviformis]
MRNFLLLLSFLVVAASQAQTIGVERQRVVLTSPETSFKIYNQVTGERISEEELMEIVRKRGSTYLDKDFNKYGQPTRGYYHPDSAHLTIRNRNQHKQIQPGEELPKFVFTLVDGTKLRSKKLRGKWVLLKFDLVVEFLDYPDYEALAAQVDALDEKYPLVAITCLRDNEENIRTGIGGKYDPIRWMGEGTGFQEKYFISRLPTSVLLDPKGRVVTYFRYHEKMDLEETILRHLSETSTAR